jgi:DNA-binding transcriptional ArsR family regulator
MEKKLLLNGKLGQYTLKDILILDEPKRLQGIVSELGWKILRLLSEKEMYPIEIAKKLNIHEQKVYYHIRRLSEAGIVRIVRKEEKQGAVIKYYRASSPAFGVELPFDYRPTKTVSFPIMEERLKNFFNPLIRDCTFDGRIVVGSPDPHGPFKARSRDGHYASYLALRLGRFIDLPEDFVIKLDVDVKAEKEENTNLILVGGPGTNLITHDINEFLPSRFNVVSSEHGFLLGGIVSKKTGNVYIGDAIGLVAKIVNPKNRDKRIIVLAGNRSAGTKACILSLTKFWEETLKNFNDEENFATVIQGFDLDGDGKVDSIEVVE